jgi:DNA modification methylase
MEKHTKPGDLVIEPFSGSGSQLVAAEKLRRKCRAMEISPAFVDVAIRRWERASGKRALLDGRPFDEVAEMRANSSESSPSDATER